MAREFDSVTVDVGTGDGAFVRRLAERQPSRLIVGVDANVDGMRDTARRLARAKRRNALLARMAAEDAPGDLAGLADSLTVLLPWSGLLRTVAAVRDDGLAGLRGLCRPGASVRIVFGYDEDVDGRFVGGLELPHLDNPDVVPRLWHGYARAGFDVRVRGISNDDVRALGTSWAKKLTHADRGRRFLEIAGHVVPAEPGDRRTQWSPGGDGLDFHPELGSGQLLDDQ